MKNKLTLIKRSAPFCPECNKMQFILDNNGVQYETIDIAVDKDAVEKYNLKSVPVMLINDGDTEIKLVGVQPLELIQELLED